MSEKTEEPTEKKLQDAKNKGQSPKSADLAAAAVLVVGLLTLTGMAPDMLDRMSDMLKHALTQGMRDQGNQQLLAVTQQMLLDGLVASAPLVIVSVLVALLAMFGQVGVIISMEPITPKFENLDPAAGLKRIFSPRSLIELVKSIVKAVALACVLYACIRSLLPLVVGAAYLPLMASAALAWKAILQLLAAACAVFVVVGPVDFGLQRFLFIRDQRMSKDEIKREYKENEGDPMLKGERRALQQEMATSAPQQRVPGANVVVTNPTHYAVALRYDPLECPVPLVVAKGVDAEAAVIRAIAAQHGVPLVANPPLARALHKVPLDGAVPDALFDAVAAVLRWVEDLRRNDPPPAPPASAIQPVRPL